MLADGPDSVGAEPRLEAVVANRRLAVVSISFARRFVEGGEPVGRPEPGRPVVFRSVKRPSCGAIVRRDTANLALLRSLEPTQWSRAGTQEGVGRVAVCDIPHMMAEHDESHRAEISAGRRRG